MGHGSRAHHRKNGISLRTKRSGASVCAWRGCGTRLNHLNRNRYCCVHLPEALKRNALLAEQRKAVWDEKRRKRAAVVQHHRTTTTTGRA